MRIQVKQSDRQIVVRAVSDDGYVIAGMKAEAFTPDQGHEEMHELWGHAAELCLEGHHELADETLEDVNKIHRCELAADQIADQIRDAGGVRDMTAFGVTELSGEGEGERDATFADAVLRMYRAAAVSAGRRKAVLLANACLAPFAGQIDWPGIESWVWKQPEFRRDMVIIGPVAFHREQMALPRVANLRRSLLH